MSEKLTIGRMTKTAVFFFVCLFCSSCLLYRPSLQAKNDFFSTSSLFLTNFTKEKQVKSLYFLKSLILKKIILFNTFHNWNLNMLFGIKTFFFYVICVMRVWRSYLKHKSSTLLTLFIYFLRLCKRKICITWIKNTGNIWIFN